jgi:hypothetical protein
MTIKKIVAGGQTGADRAGLDWAIWHKIPHGGWCPKGRRAEDGVIPAFYRLDPTPTAHYRQRTEWNVRDSDATVIFTIRPRLTAGSLLTDRFARQHHKPVLHLYPSQSYQTAETLLRFVATNNVSVLNVAGARASEARGIYDFAKTMLETAFFSKSSAWIGGPGEG